MQVIQKEGELVFPSFYFFDVIYVIIGLNMNKEQKEYNFLKELNSFLDGKLWNYKRKIELMEDITGLKQDLLDTIGMVLPEDADKIITKSKKEDYIGKQMKLLELNQMRLKRQVKGILKGKHREKKPSLNIESRKGIVSIGD